MKRPNTRTATTALVALILPITLLVGAIASAYYKSTNPDNVDVTQGLAYLGQTMTISFVTFAVLIILAIIGIVKMYRADGSMCNAKLPLALLVTIVVLLGSYALVGSYTSKVQDQYLIDHGRPTLQQFFDKVKE